MKVSVIIASYNSAGMLSRCLEALARQTYPREDFEVIVVDDGSTDNTKEICERFLGVRYLYQRNQGPAVARNAGVGKASYGLVVFTDADCEPEPDWLERLIAPFVDPQISAVKGAYRTRQREFIARLVQLEYEAKYERLKKFRYIDFIDTYSAAYRRDAFLSCGGFDERYRTPSVEDQELSFRLFAGGHKMLFVPEAVVWHRHPASLGSYWRKKYKNGYWKAFLIRTHPGRASGDHHTPQTYKLQILLAGALLPLLIGAPFCPVARVGGLLMGLVFLGMSLPFALFAARRDLTVGALSPLLSFIRSVALGLGLAAGFKAHWLSGRLTHRKPEVQAGQKP